MEFELPTFDWQSSVLTTRLSLPAQPPRNASQLYSSMQLKTGEAAIAKEKRRGIDDDRLTCQSGVNATEDSGGKRKPVRAAKNDDCSEAVGMRGNSLLFFCFIVLHQVAR